MAKVESYQCDVCGKQKGEVNHWWLATLDHPEELTLGTWPKLPGEYPVEGAFHLCGSECVIKKVNEFLQANGRSAATETRR